MTEYAYIQIRFKNPNSRCLWSLAFMLKFILIFTGASIYSVKWEASFGTFADWSYFQLAEATFQIKLESQINFTSLFILLPSLYCQCQSTDIQTAIIPLNCPLSLNLWISSWSEIGNVDKSPCLNHQANNSIKSPQFTYLSHAYLMNMKTCQVIITWATLQS